MTLRDLLQEIDFDYEIENGEIKLIDKQGAYFGDIGEERWRAEQASVSAIIDRMEIYWDDYVYDGIVNPSLNQVGNKLEDYNDNGDYTELLEYCKTHDITDYLVDILYCIVHPEEVNLEEDRSSAPTQQSDLYRRC